MKKLRFAILAFFIVVTVAFAAFMVRDYLTKDTTAPVITADTDNLEASVSATDEELMEGMTAKDDKDGNVTDSLVVVSRSKFIEQGVLKVNYAAFDSHNNVGTYVRTLTYTDYTSPRITLTKPLVVRQGSDSYDIMSGITAEDCIDGDVTGQLKMVYDNGSTRYVLNTSDSEVDADITLSLSNSVGDTVSLPLQVRFLPDDQYTLAAPALSEYLVYTKVGEKLDLDSYVTGIWQAGNTVSFSKLKGTDSYTEDDVTVISKKPDYDTPGVYQVEYQLTGTVTSYVKGEKVTDTEDLGTAVLFVVVEE